MTTWVTSDLHFFHKNIIKYCDRPYDDVSQMNAAIVENIMAVVEKDDHVYHLGDFMFGKLRSTFDSLFAILPGKWHFIVGNHDKHTIWKWKDELIEHERIVEIVKEATIEHNGKSIYMNHYETDEELIQTDYHFFGHSHCPYDMVLKHPNRRDVGFDGSLFQLQTVDWHIEEILKRNHLTYDAPAV